MAKRSRVMCLAVCLLLVGGVVATAEEGGKHLVHFGVNPFSWIWADYNFEVGVPLSGLLEVGASLDYWDFVAAAEIFGSDPVDAADNAKLFTVGAFVRVFPAKTASGFFIGGRVSYFHINSLVLPDSINDLMAGVDIGWRWKWPLSGNFGLFFQADVGIQRWISQDISAIWPLPILPRGGLLFGVFI
jgi:hypothetical protein